jgi:hypothetical protein
MSKGRLAARESGSRGGRPGIRVIHEAKKVLGKGGPDFKVCLKTLLQKVHI